MIERRRQQVGDRRGASQRGERKALKADSGCDGCNGLYPIWALDLRESRVILV